MSGTKKGIVSGIDILVLMDKPGLKGCWEGVLQKGDPVEIIKRDGFYTKIKFDDTEGYVRSRFIQEVLYGSGLQRDLFRSVLQKLQA